jgi:hypothetical protein
MGDKRFMSYEINKNTDYELIPDKTELECRIEKMTFKTTTSGRRYIDVSFRVRDDVDSNGQFKNRVLFKAIWSLKDKPDMYNPVDISNLTNTQDYEGNSITFSTIDDVITYLTGISLRVKVGIEESEQYGNKNICSKFFKTNFAPKKVEKVEATKSEQTSEEDLSVVSEDLPF